MTYLLFAGQKYDSFGGAYDCYGRYETLEDAIAAIDTVLVETTYEGVTHDEILTGEYAEYVIDEHPLTKPDWVQIAELIDTGLNIVHQWKEDWTRSKPHFNRVTRELIE